MSVPMALGMGISGQPFIGADIPGFCAHAEPGARGALDPVRRAHAVLPLPQPQRASPISIRGRSVPKSKSCAARRSSFAIACCRTSTAHFMRASETGEPIQRPLAYDFQHDRARARDGRRLPVRRSAAGRAGLQAGQHRASGVPPAGHLDRLVHRRAPLGRRSSSPPARRSIEFRCSRRGGYVVPAYEIAPRSTMGHYPELLVLHVFVPDEDGDFDSYLHEDDGLTLDFQSGAYLRTAFPPRPARRDALDFGAGDRAGFRRVLAAVRCAWCFTASADRSSCSTVERCASRTEASSSRTAARTFS